jgi:hypothetical protein
MSSASSAPEYRNETHLGDETAKELSTDEVALIFGFFTCEDIMRLRRVCKTWRDAAKKTLVPLFDDSVREYNAMRVMSTALPNLQQISNAMRVMSTALPNLQQISLRSLGWGHKYNDGEDQDERMAAFTANYTAHDIDIISSFRNRKLHTLKIHDAPLNGRYPFLFNFPLLQKLSITNCSCLNWNLEMLEGLPSLKIFSYNERLSIKPNVTGSLASLRVLKDTLENVQITSCCNIRGNFMALADFPLLRELNLRFTAVTGDIRDIGERDFPALESLFLPKSVIGGIEYKFQNASDVRNFMRSLRQQAKVF